MKKTALTAAAGLIALTSSAALAMEISVTDLFDLADSNRDGRITYRESQLAYPGLPEQLFKMADSNKDGVLDESEFWELSGLTAAFPATTQEEQPK